MLNEPPETSGKIKLSGMIRIFKRSETSRNLKYTGYICDDDAKTFSAISDAKPYGPGVAVSKTECVGHIQKRMSTRLQKFKINKVKCSDGKTVGGKDRLPDKIIDKLTSYYGNAIRQHKDNLNEMREAV